MTKKEMKKWLLEEKEKMEIVDNNWKAVFGDEPDKIKSVYLGSYMSLDPCGRYHHILSPNGVTKKCLKFWEDLENVAESIKCYITVGEGDPTDIYMEQMI